MSKSLDKIEVHSSQTVSRYYFTTLSNFALGYERYSRSYNKKNISHSKFSSRFFLLSEENIDFGINKTRKLVAKLAIPGDQVVALRSNICPTLLYPNSDTKIGEFIESGSIDLSAVYRVDSDSRLNPCTFEDLYTASLALIRPCLSSWVEVQPRSVSILPIAIGCQASCPFCFSEASVSLHTQQHQLDLDRASKVLESAKQHGAERAVITGGGEPGLLKFEKLVELVKLCSQHFEKVVLISNGYFLAKLPEQELTCALRVLHASGLSVLAISRHHYQSDRNSDLMRLRIESEIIPATWHRIREEIPKLKLRWICVLQRNGIETVEDVRRYVHDAQEAGVTDVCFKELYVASHLESVYYSEATNLYSAKHQVSLRTVLDAARANNWKLKATLPWGAPIFEADNGEAKVSIAAYTEPNTTWELTNGICRSWNLMADGTCFASLEDKRSILELR